MKIKVVILLFLALSLNSFSQISSQEVGGQETGDYLNTITTAVPFLRIAPDARSGALGDAGLATKPDVNSGHFNASKYAFMKNDIGFSVSYTPWLRKLVDDINLAYVAGYKKIDKNQTVALSLLYFSLGSITFTDEIGSVTGNFTPNEFAVSGSYIRKFSDYFSGALSARYIYSNLTGGYSLSGGSSSHAGQTVAADATAFYKKNIELFSKKADLMIGLAITNMGGKVSYSESLDKNFIPTNLGLGVGLDFQLDNYNTLGFYADFNKLMVPTPPQYALDSLGQNIIENGKPVVFKGQDPNVSTVSGMFGSFSDAPGGGKEELREIAYSFGLEYWYDGNFAIRGGYFNENAYKGNRKYFTLGAGLKYNVFGLDFAYLIPTEQRHPLENTLRFTISFDFEGLKKENSSTTTPTPAN